MRDRLIFGLIVVLILGPLFIAAQVAAGDLTLLAPSSTPAPVATPQGPVASPVQLATAQAEWAASEHARTYDEGQGANTTCARCKAPLNWDPSQEAAQQMAMDCGSCKREPGAERPLLEGGVPVPEAEWHNINCDVCHIPVGDSYDVNVAFWNQALGRYESVESSSELCAHCHEGQHGFRVMEEQEASQVHVGMECTECHGSHGADVSCEDCHDPQNGSGAAEHARHPSVNCSGCHDREGLSVWQDLDPLSDHFGQYVTRRFAHTLTSWPSHNITLDVDCTRCHHPLGDRQAVLVPYVACADCHEHADGAVSLWCTYFQRDVNPLREEE